MHVGTRSCPCPGKIHACLRVYVGIIDLGLGEYVKEVVIEGGGGRVRERFHGFAGVQGI